CKLRSLDVCELDLPRRDRLGLGFGDLDSRRAAGLGLRRLDLARIDAGQRHLWRYGRVRFARRRRQDRSLTRPGRRVLDRLALTPGTSPWRRRIGPNGGYQPVTVSLIAALAPDL